ncbi:MAG TPA: phospho-sugar mutase [Patescibacteria group bacterium]|nr:phospho-sugar mutase [Patescibacteria group bacterium]
MPEYTAHVSESAAKNINEWLTESKYAEYKQELETMIAEKRWKELEDAFFKVIEFGTAGRRGTTGVGSNRINRVTIGESAQALCQYAKQADPDAPQKGVVIACDTRLSSPELSQYAASVAAANGFKTYLFESFRATPELSFAVRELGCAVGIVISASHNPPADNGFKAYWSDGGQIAAPHDTGVLDTAATITEIASTDFDQAVENGDITIIGSALDEAYFAAVHAQALGRARDVKIAYSPLHGAGQTNVLPVLRQAGFTDIVLVDDQMVPDGNFPTVEAGKPNPEERAANDRVVALMLAMRADIAFTNDPDADRFGTMVRVGDEAVYLNGNQSAILAADFILSKLQASGQLDSDDYIVKTIVTTDMLSALAKSYGVGIVDNLLVGFKYIAEVIRNREGDSGRFIMGAEESYGMLKGDYARDKDGATGVLPLAEYAAELKAQGKTLYDRLLELYGEHGLYVERQDTMVCPGAEGFAEMQAIMKSLRDEAPTEIDGHKVTAVIDYASATRTDIASGEQSTVDAATGNVFVLEFGDSRRRVTVRPSGTEPKLKFYNQWYEPTDDARRDYDDLMQRLENMSRELEGILFARIGKTKA